MERMSPDGGHWHIHSYPVFDEGGTLVALAEFARDVSLQKEAEERFRRSQAMLTRTERIAHVGSWEWEIAGDVVTWSEELFRIFGLDPSLGAPNWAQHPSLYHPEDFERLRLAAEEAVSNGIPYELELRARRKDGQTRFCLARGFSEMGPDGKAVRLFGSLQDITDLRRAEEALRASEERLRLANKVTNDVVWDWDIVKDEQLWNESGSAVFGWTDIVSRPQRGAWWVERVHPDDRERVEEGFFSFVNNPGKDYWHDEYRFLRADGTYAEVMDRGHVLRDDHGKALRMIGAMLDITERKRAEEERKKLQDQFLQAQKMESVGRLAGGVAHDFNNMLAVIMGHAEMGLEEIAPPHPVHARLLQIMNTAERSGDLVRQLLAFARKQTIAPKVLDLNETAEGMLKMLRRLIGEDIHLAWMPGAGLWTIKMDPSQIDQILANLAVNSRDAITDVGKVTIETENIALDREYCADHPGFLPGEYVLLAFSDDGCGMGKETLERLFEPFFTTKAVGKGTGLGLATVYGIVKQNEGFIHVYSEPGQGTTFKVYLPRNRDEGQGKGAQASTQPVRGGHDTVLLVEDEPMLLEMGRSMLQRLGYRVLTARAPEEAIREAQEHEGGIHLLMTDVVMPVMNGRDLAGRLQSLYPGIRCLFMSGYTANVIAHHGVLDPGVHFIQKPFSLKDLAATVREVLDQEK